MAPYSTGRLTDDVVDVVWPVLVLLLLLVVAVALSAGSPLRLLIALIAVLVFPGYVLSLVVFPLRTTDRDGSFGRHRSEDDWFLPGLRKVERWAVAVGFSIALMPVYGFLIAITGLSYAVDLVVLVVLSVSAVFALLAFVRRHRLPSNTDISVPVRPAPIRVLRTLAGSRGKLPPSTVVVTVTLMVAVATLVVGLTAPPESPAYTSASLLTAGPDGELVAEGYPHDLAPDERADLVLVLTNHERTTVEYTVIAQSQMVATDGTVTERRHIDQFSVRLRDGETWERPHRIAPLMGGDRVRLVYLVYRGAPPSEPTIDNAYRSLTLWVREPLPGESSQTEAALSPNDQWMRESAARPRLVVG
ncbi:DUF1616 domain-containing protein (plasmid) [Haloferax sp. S1W]|uniref:DUF1616 domain-containing protein n=1 Tax=Haloferax sp. S1W TaxID=3377110 RepID=UPI0037CC53D6